MKEALLDKSKSSSGFAPKVQRRYGICGQSTTSANTQINTTDYKPAASGSSTSSIVFLHIGPKKRRLNQHCILDLSKSRVATDIEAPQTPSSVVGSPAVLRDPGVNYRGIPILMQMPRSFVTAKPITRSLSLTNFAFPACRTWVLGQCAVARLLSRYFVQ